MTTIVTGAWSGTGLDATPPAADATRGWYLYGITRRAPLAALLADADAAQSAGATAATRVAALELIECGGLAAVVRPVPLADFGVEVLQQRLRNAPDLDAMVRGHNHVIEAIHARQAILPAKLGMVYTHARDIVSSLRAGCDTLLPRLHRLEGRDEWALHLFADRAVVGRRAASLIPALARLRDEHAASRPGRAYFIERRLRAEQDAATRQALLTLAQDAFARLSAVAVAGQASPVKARADTGGEAEILRAAFLVARDGIERFEDVVRAVADADSGLRCESSGPWPPYSFAADDAGEAT